MSTQIRVFRPLAVDKTEVTIYCIAPKGEDRQSRDHRLRQYEDFFNASGMATPDDLAEFEYCMEGYQAAKFAPFNDSARGFKHLSHGPDARAEELGIAPSLCGSKLEDEAIFWRNTKHGSNGWKGLPNELGTRSIVFALSRRSSFG